MKTSHAEQSKTFFLSDELIFSLFLFFVNFLQFFLFVSESEPQTLHIGAFRHIYQVGCRGRIQRRGDLRGESTRSSRVGRTRGWLETGELCAGGRGPPLGEGHRPANPRGASGACLARADRLLHLPPAAHSLDRPVGRHTRDSSLLFHSYLIPSFAATLPFRFASRVLRIDGSRPRKVDPF